VLFIRISLVSAFALLSVVPILSAQVPDAQGNSATTGTLAGVVRDTLGQLMPGVDVSIPELDRTVRSDASGAFVLAQIPPGTHEVSARKLGMIMLQFHWSAHANERVELALTLRPLPNTLDPVIIWENETKAVHSTAMIRGIVVDSGGIPLDGAEVELIGSGRATVTAGDGTFAFRHVRQGPATVRARMLGLAPSTHGMKIGDGDEREIVLRMGYLPQLLDEMQISDQSGYGRSNDAWKDLDRRERLYFEGRSRIFNAEQLAQMGSLSLDFATRGLDGGGPERITTIKVGNSTPINLGASGLPGEACILENGMTPTSRPLSSYNVDDLQLVEYYPPASPRGGSETEHTGSVQFRMTGVPGCSGDFGQHPAYFVVWFKGAK
jgi:Carboxypeptidase regulatory-like domain